MSEVEDQDPPVPDSGLEEIIQKISTEHAFDVRGYKRSTLYRRLQKRMADAGCSGPEAYLVRLDIDPNEYERLVDTILINVTEFFRDPPAWEFLQQHCAQALVRRRGAGSPIRIWSVGCASGEEAYSLSILFHELIGEQSLRDFKIYATDVDPHALATARAAVYTAADLQHVSPARLHTYFDALPGGRYAVKREVRSSVIFGQHNILKDPPISRLDLLVCRNLLIYFDADTQQQLLPRFHYAVRSEGYLFLGKAETLMTRSHIFRPLEPRFRVFQRVPPSAGDSLHATLDYRRTVLGPYQDSLQVEAENYMLHAVIDRAADPVFLLDPSGRILMASDPARELFEIKDGLSGVTLLDMAERLRPVALRLALEDARTAARSTHLDQVEIVKADGSRVQLQVDVSPILNPMGNPTHILLWGHDETEWNQLAVELDHTREELETVTEELQTTNEELETTNEELQSTNEELETTNEELQSTNEELETTIEELQSSNEELESANDELRARQDTLDALTRYQDMVLSSLQAGLVVLDERCVVITWNRVSENTWGLREEEVVGRQFFSLDIGLDVRQLEEPLSQLMRGESLLEKYELAARDRRGRPVHCVVRMNALREAPGEPPASPGGAVLIIEARPRS